MALYQTKSVTKAFSQHVANMIVESSSNFGEFDDGLAQVPPKSHLELKQLINVAIFAMLDFNHLQIITLERHDIMALERSISPFGSLGRGLRR